MELTIENHLLKGNVRWMRSPNHSGLIRLPGALPDTIVIHYTAGASAESSARSLCDKNSKQSAHLIIGLNGEIIQLVEFNVIAWHAGISEHKETGRKGINNFSIGIELDNAGLLTKTTDGMYRSWFGRKYPESETVQAVHRHRSIPEYWHAFTENQLNVALIVCRILAAKYPIKYILGHDEISPVRKIDPGPAFPLDQFVDKVLHSGRDDGLGDFNAISLSSKMTVNAPTLNIRTGPSHLDDILIPGGLPQGTEVTVLDHSGKWFRVNALGTTGWVNAKYLVVVNE